MTVIQAVTSPARAVGSTLVFPKNVEQTAKCASEVAESSQALDKRVEPWLAKLTPEERQAITDLRQNNPEFERVLKTWAEMPKIADADRVQVLKQIATLRQGLEEFFLQKFKPEDLTADARLFVKEQARTAAADILGADVLGASLPADSSFAKQLKELCGKVYQQAKEPNSNPFQVYRLLSLLAREARESVCSPEQRTVLLAKDAEGRTVIERLLTIAQDDFKLAPIFKQNCISKWDLLTSLMESLGRPAAIHSGVGLCGVAAQHYIFSQHPALAISMVEKMLKEGRLTLPCGAQIEITQDFLRQDESPRSTLGRIMQSCFMRYAAGEDWTYSATDNTLRSKRNPQIAFPGGGIHPIGQLWLANGLFNAPHRQLGTLTGDSAETQFAIIKKLIANNREDAVRGESLCAATIEMQHEGRASNHAVVPAYMKEEGGQTRVYYYSSASPFIRGKELGNPPRRCEGNGMESMEVNDFVRCLKGMIYPEAPLPPAERIGQSLPKDMIWKGAPLWDPRNAPPSWAPKSAAPAASPAPPVPKGAPDWDPPQPGNR